MDKLKAFVLNNTTNFILLSVVYSLLCAFFPLKTVYYNFFTNEAAFNVLYIISKLLFSVLPFVFFLAVKEVFCVKKDAFSKLTLAVCFLIAVNNFPFFTVFEGFGTLSTSLGVWLNHIFLCLSIGIFEELVFRGIIFTLYITVVFKNQRYKEIKSVLLSSLLFSLIHIVNVFSGEEWYFVLLQTAYSFLTGCIFALSYYISGKLRTPIILHFLYNLGGLLQDNSVISGGLWSVSQTIETIVLSIFAAIIILTYVYKNLIKDNL